MPAAREKLPEHTGDKSGVGVHYVDAYIKPMNLKLPDGTPVKCKRRGLKIVLSAGGKKGEGLLRRLVAGPDPVVMLDAALAGGGEICRNRTQRGRRQYFYRALTSEIAPPVPTVPSRTERAA